MKKNIRSAIFISLLGIFVLTHVNAQERTRSQTSPAKEVSTNTDPSYIYFYDKPKFVPPKGSVLLITGQDKSAIKNYIKDTGVISGGFACYFAVSSNTGITNDQEQGTEVQNADWIARTFPNTVLQTAMWLAGKWDRAVIKKILDHSYDANIDTFSAWARKADRPVFLRIGYEFDGPHNELMPEDYKAVYKYIVDRIRSAGVKNVAFVWHSWADRPYKNFPVTNWYPGDDYVDWFGISCNCSLWRFRAKTFMDPFVDLARAHKKPVMIAESTPVGGIVPNSTRTWNDWFVPVFSYIHEKNIKAFSYINCDWDSITEFAGSGWGDSRVQQFPLIHERWTNEINKPSYLKQSSGLFKILGY